MDRMIYLSLAGAKALMQRQDALTHNLSNAGTDGLVAIDGVRWIWLGE